MKTTINKIVWLCFIAIVSVSCSKNDDCDPKDEDSPCYAGPTAGSDLLLIEERTNGKTEMRFEYNDRNQVVVRHVHGVEGNVTHENFTYNGDKLIKVERRSNGELVMSEEFTYGAGNRPTKGIYKDNKGRVLANITYAYSVNKVTERSFNREGQQVGINTYTFDTIGKNIIKQVTGIQDISLVTIEYGDYDNKPCRYTNYPWAWKVGSAVIYNTKENEKSYFYSHGTYRHRNLCPAISKGNYGSECRNWSGNRSGRSWESPSSHQCFCRSRDMGYWWSGNN